MVNEQSKFARHKRGQQGGEFVKYVNAIYDYIAITINSYTANNYCGNIFFGSVG